MSRLSYCPRQMAGEIASLADGTIARLCGSPRRDDIDLYRDEWRAWVLGERQRGARWCSWQDCHREYTLYLQGCLLAPEVVA